MEKVPDKIMKSKSLLLLIFSGSIFISCTNSKTSTSTKNNMDTLNHQHTSISKILSKQLESGSSMEYAATDYTKEDFAEAANAANDILKKNGYTAKDDFNTKLKSVFGNQSFKDNELNALSYETGCLVDEKKAFSIDEAGESSSLLVDLKNKLITDFYPLPLLINYEKDYPELAQLEKNPLKAHDEVEKSDVELKRWKDYANLSANRQKNRQTIISRNKYIFNDSKAEFAWLKNNDQDFLTRLITVFGYVKDNSLNQWGLDRNLIQPNKNNERDFGSILWNKSCTGKINVHQEIFDLIKSLSSDANTKYLGSLADYIIYLRDKDKILPFAQKAEVIAKVAYYAQKIVNTNQKTFEHDFYIRFLFPIIQETQSKDLFEPEFKKNNYYNLQGFKELWDEQNEYNGGVGLAM